MWKQPRFKLTVHKTRNVKPKGKTGTNDSYVVVIFGDEKHKTSVKERTLNPDWNEDCFLNLSTNENATLKVKVCHRNFLLVHDELIGHVDILLKQFTFYESPKTNWFRLQNKESKDEGEILLTLTYEATPSITSDNPTLKKSTSFKNLASKFGEKLSSVKKPEKDLKKRRESLCQMPRLPEVGLSITEFPTMGGSIKDLFWEPTTTATATTATTTTTATPLSKVRTTATSASFDDSSDELILRRKRKSEPANQTQRHTVDFSTLDLNCTFVDIPIDGTDEDVLSSTFNNDQQSMSGKSMDRDDDNDVNKNNINNNNNLNNNNNISNNNNSNNSINSNNINNNTININNISNNNSNDNNINNNNKLDLSVLRKPTSKTVLQADRSTLPSFDSFDSSHESDDEEETANGNNNNNNNKQNNNIRNNNNNNNNNSKNNNNNMNSNSNKKVTNTNSCNTQEMNAANLLRSQLDIYSKNELIQLVMDQREWIKSRELYILDMEAYMNGLLLKVLDNHGNGGNNDTNIIVNHNDAQLQPQIKQQHHQQHQQQQHQQQQQQQQHQQQQSRFSFAMFNHNKPSSNNNYNNSGSKNHGNNSSNNNSNTSDNNNRISNVKVDNKSIAKKWFGYIFKTKK